MLASIGSTASDLINSAHDYVIAEKQLPTAKPERARSREEFASFAEASTIEIEWPSDYKGDYKAQIKQGKVVDYEPLA